MEKVVKHQRNGRLASFIIFSLFFILVSGTTFLAVRIIFPVFANGGRTSIYTVPAFLTYILPLFIFYLTLMAMFAKTVKGRLRFIRVLGLIALFVGLFNIVDISFCIGLLWDGKVIVDIITPLFPLDVLLISIVYFIGGIAGLIYCHIDHQYVLSVGVSRAPLKTSTMVLAGFYIPIACYYFGEFLSGYMYIRDHYVDPNWVNMIPHYLSFILLGLYFGLYMMTRYQTDPIKKEKFSMMSLIFVDATSLIVFAWEYISIIIDPSIIGESLQWEYSLGLCGRYPIGMFLITAICLIVALVASIKLIKFKRKPKNEQE